MKLLVCFLCGLMALPALATTHEPTPGERLIADAEHRVAAAPAQAAPLIALAMAYSRRARETADAALYDRALASLDRALEIAPGDVDAARARVWALLGKHEFAAALREAKALNARFPDDLTTYALLVDANVELGRYADAEAAAQWLLDLRPGNIPGLTRAAYLRELYGDLDGSLELMLQALQRTPPGETEERAWLLTQVSHLQLNAGRLAYAERAADDALALFPAYHYALHQLALVREAQGRHADALALRRQHVAAAPHPENRLWLARALARNGHASEADAEFAGFVSAARAETDKWDNANRELIDYLANEGRDAAGALALAEREYARRQDLQTRAAFAWALHCNGRHAAAWQQAQAMLDLGTRDPALLYRAGIIADAAGERSRAQPLLRDALTLAPWHALAKRATALLADRVASAR